MFNPSVSDVRNFFFESYAKGINNNELTNLEKVAFSIINQHPEYHPILANRDKYMEYNWHPEQGQTNPFLHLSMHMAIYEQLSIDQPSGIADLYHELLQKVTIVHDVEHQIMDCLGEMLWHSQTNQQPPDAQIYLNCLRAKLAKL